MISKIKNLKKVMFTVGSAIAMTILSTTTVEARYNAIYFDARFDMTRYRLNISASGFDTNGELGLEDKYVSQWEKGYDNMPSWRGSRTDSAYYKAMDPDKGKDVYSNTNKFLDGTMRQTVEQIAKKFDPQKESTSHNHASPKKNTVPAGRYTLVDGKGKTVDHSGLRLDEGHGKVMASAICGVEDREDKGTSMEQSFNVLLEKIEMLRGGYTDETFKQTVKGLTYLITYGGEGSSIKMKVSGDLEAGEEAIKPVDNGGDNPPNTTDPSKEDFVGTGGDITISVTKVGTHRKGIKITQHAGENKTPIEVVHVQQLFKVSTGYTATSLSGEGKATIKINGKDTTLTAEAQDNLKDLKPEDIAYITLYDLVFDAFIKLNSGVTSSGTANNSSNPITNLIVDIADGLVGFVEEQLSLERMEDLVYNLETREQNIIEETGYDLGMYPRAWKSLIQECLNIMTLLSTLFLVFAILRVLILMNLDSMNVNTRLNLKQDIMNIIVAVIGMMMFAVLFYTLGLFNYKITEMLYNGLPGSNVDFFTTFVGSSGALASIIMRCIMLGVKVYLNVVYLMRSLNISILVILAPVFIVGTAFLGTERIKLYLRELVGNIFLQSFHAMIIWFIINAKQNIGINGDGTDLFVSVVMAVSIIPVTSMFRELVFGDSKSLSSAGRIAGQAQQTVKGLGAQGVQLASGALSLATGGVAAGANIVANNNFNNFKDFQKRQKDLQSTQSEAGGGFSSSPMASGPSGVSTSTNMPGATSSSTTATKEKEEAKKEVKEAVSDTMQNMAEQKHHTVDDVVKEKETVKEQVETVQSSSSGGSKNTDEYFDSSLEKGYGKVAIGGASIANNIRQVVALSNAIKSGGTGMAMQQYLKIKDENKQTMDYMKQNTKAIHKNYQNESKNTDENQDA